MARNKKRARVSGGFFFPAPIAGGMILICALGLGYVWLECQCESLGRDIRNMEIENKVLMKRYCNEKCLWSQMRAPSCVEAELKRQDIVMTWPRSGQVVRMRDTGAIVAELMQTDLDSMKLAKAGK